MKTFFVYGIWVDGTLRYVGKGSRDSASGYDRLKHYRPPWTCAQISPPLRKRLAEAAMSFIEVREIETATSEIHAYQLEALWYKANKDSLWNMTTGGHSGWTARPETRAKMSAARLGKKASKPHSPETRLKMSLAKKGRKQTVEHNAKIAKAARRQWAEGRGWRSVLMDARPRRRDLFLVYKGEAVP